MTLVPEHYRRDGAPDEVERSYRQHVAEVGRNRLRAACALLTLIFVLDGGYEWWSRPAAFWQEFWVRLSAIALFAGAVVFFAKPRSVQVVIGGAALVSVAVTVDVETALLALGPSGGVFFTGLVLVVVASGLLFPFELVPTLGLMSLVWLVFVATAGAHGFSGSFAPFTDQVFLLLCGTLLGIAGSVSMGRLRRREFLASAALAAEKALSDRLLLNILPEAIADRLKRGEATIADRVKEVSVAFADIVGFTPLSEKMSADELVQILDEVFSAFDAAAAKRGLEKIKTIGDAYMVAAGIPTQRDDHLEAIADMAIDMRSAIEQVNERRSLELAVRIGIHSGPVVAGVIGKTKFSYDVWGDTVNTASRMESHGAPGEIHVTEHVRERLAERYEFSEPRVVSVKGKGELRTCFLLSKRADGSLSGRG